MKIGDKLYCVGPQGISKEYLEHNGKKWFRYAQQEPAIIEHTIVGISHVNLEGEVPDGCYMETLYYLENGDEVEESCIDNLYQKTFSCIEKAKKHLAHFYNGEL